MECIFCKLGTETGKHLYDSKNCYAVLDINPLTKGHLLVIPKEHYGSVMDMPKELTCEVFSVARDMGALAIEKLGATGVNIGTNVGRDAGQVIMHAHVHVVPRYKGMRMKRSKLSAGMESELIKLLSKA